MAHVLGKKCQSDVVVRRNRTGQIKLRRRTLVTSLHRSRIGLKRNFIQSFHAAVGRPHTQTWPIDRREQIGIHTDAIGSRFVVSQRQTGEVAIRQIAKRRVFEHIVAIPLHHSPIELLPPRAGHFESACAGAAQRGNRGRPLKVTLQVPVWPQLLKYLGRRHCYNLTVTVKSLPGVLSFVCPTETTSSPSCAPPASGFNPKPSTIFDVVWPIAIVKLQ